MAFLLYNIGDNNNMGWFSDRFNKGKNKGNSSSSGSSSSSSSKPQWQQEADKQKAKDQQNIAATQSKSPILPKPEGFNFDSGLSEGMSVSEASKKGAIIAEPDKPLIDLGGEVANVIAGGKVMGGAINKAGNFAKWGADNLHKTAQGTFNKAATNAIKQGTKELAVDVAKAAVPTAVQGTTNAIKNNIGNKGSSNTSSSPSSSSPSGSTGGYASIADNLENHYDNIPNMTTEELIAQRNDLRDHPESDFGGLNADLQQAYQDEINKRYRNGEIREDGSIPDPDDAYFMEETIVDLPLGDVDTNVAAGQVNKRPSASGSNGGGKHGNLTNKAPSAIGNDKTPSTSTPSSPSSSTPTPSSPVPSKPEKKPDLGVAIDAFTKKYSKSLEGWNLDDDVKLKEGSNTYREKASGPQQAKSRMEQQAEENLAAVQGGEGVDINKMQVPGAKNSIVGTSVGSPTVGSSNGPTHSDQMAFEAERSYTNSFGDTGYAERADSVGLAPKTTINYGEDPWNQGMEKQSNTVVSDKQMKIFIKNCNRDPVLKGAVHRIAGRL